jgi:cytochrome P450
MSIPTTTTLDGPGGIFVDPRAFADLDSWHQKADALRAADPVHRIEIDGYVPFYALTRHADVFEIERQHDVFRNTLQSVLFQKVFYERQQETGMYVKSLVHMDGHEHDEYRKLTNDWFKPANLRKLVEARVNELSRQFVDKMMERGPECDFAREIGLLFPLHVIMTILGVPEPDEPMMLRLTQELFASDDPEFEVENLADVVGSFFEYFNDLTEDRRKSPADDIATVLSTGMVDGEPLGDIERIGYYMIVATAGHDTTSNSINGGLDALMRHPDQLRALQEDPSKIDKAVDEIIRWATPVRHFLRYATEDYDLRGVKIREGEAVLLSYLAANRDDSLFENPHEFDIERENAAEHIAFGTGVHFCLGAHLARMELRVFFRELLSRIESIEPVGEPEHVVSHFVGGIKNLPVRYKLRPAA